MSGVVSDAERPHETLAPAKPEIDVAALRHPYEPSRFALAMVSSAVVASAFVFVVISAVALGGALLWGLGALVLVLILWLALQVWRVRLLADGVKVDPGTTPTVAQVVEDVRTRLQYAGRVDVFIVDRLALVIPGETRTSSLTSFFGVHVVLLEGSVIGDLQDEAARRRLTFVLATHLGALKARHARWSTLLVLLDALRLNLIAWPFVTPWLRATVYTGDRIAYVCCGDLSVSGQAVYRALVGGDAASQLRRTGLVEQALAVRRSKVLRIAQLLRATPHVPNRYLELLAFASAYQPRAFDELCAEVGDAGGQLDPLVQRRRSARPSGRALGPMAVAVSSLCLVTSIGAGLLWPAESLRWVASTAESLGWPVPESPSAPREVSPLSEVLPVDVASECDAIADPTDVGDGARAAYECWLPTDSASLLYIQYADAPATAAGFAAEVAGVPTTGDCSQGQPVRTSWSDSDAGTGGEFACFTLPNGTSAITWSTSEYHVVAYAVSNRSLDEHYAWWLTLTELGR